MTQLKGTRLDEVVEVEQLRAELSGRHVEEDRVLGIVAHDIRAPLAVIAGAMNELNHRTVGTLNAEQLSLVAIMRRATDRLNRLAQNLSCVGRARTGRLTLSSHPTDVGDLVRGVVEDVRATEELGELSLELVQPSGSISLELDHDKVRLALKNLISNALRFGKSRVTVSTEATSSSVVIQVEDDGHGVPESGGDLFERFTAIAEGTGSGFGLAVVKGVAVAHGATVTVQNLVTPSGGRGGARFTMAFPRRSLSIVPPPVA